MQRELFAKTMICFITFVVCICLCEGRDDETVGEGGIRKKITVGDTR